MLISTTKNEKCPYIVPRPQNLNKRSILSLAIMHFPTIYPSSPTFRTPKNQKFRKILCFAMTGLLKMRNPSNSGRIRSYSAHCFRRATVHFMAAIDSVFAKMPISKWPSNNCFSDSLGLVYQWVSFFLMRLGQSFCGLFRCA